MPETQDRSELITFQRFAAVCPIAIDLESIAKAAPAHPDILCRFKDSAESVAFELVEIIDRDWARITSAQFSDARRLCASLARLDPEVREKVQAGLSNALVYVAFVSSASSRERKAAVAAILASLATLPKTFAGDWHPAPGSPLLGTVRVMTIRRGRFDGPLFDVEGVGAIGDPTLECIQAKWTKSYTADSPIELLAYYELQPVRPKEFWMHALRDFVESNWFTAPFRRVWVFDVGSKTIPFVAHCPQ